MDMGDTSVMRDDGSTGCANNNFDNKNAYTNAGFSTYNIIDKNTDANTGNITSTRDVCGTNSADNNIDGKNAYARAGFSTYNVASTNADINANANDINGTGEEVKQDGWG